MVNSIAGKPINLDGMTLDKLENFLRRFTTDDRTGCWLWNGYTAKGYGATYVAGRSVRAHRITYQLANGHTDLPLDHLCRNRRCANPSHLEAVDNTTNILRGQGVTAENARKTHCKRGHEFDDKNTYRNTKGRHCKKCMRAAHKKWLGRIEMNKFKFKVGSVVVHDHSDVIGIVLEIRDNNQGYNYLIQWSDEGVTKDWYQEAPLLLAPKLSEGDS